MKKSVIIIIGVIYIASIVLIGFFGMKITAYDEILYVTKIECLNQNATTSSDGTLTLMFNYDSSKSPEENVLQIEWKVYPEDASNKRVAFVYDVDSKVGSVDKYGRVFLKKKGLLLVYIQSTDGSAVGKTLQIISVER